MPETHLLEALRTVRRRVLAIGVAAGTGWGVAAILLLLILFAWADLALDLSPNLRLTCLWLSLAAGAGLLIRAGLLALHGSTDRSVARRIDRATGSGGQILSGVDLLQQYRGDAAASLSGAMAALAVERAAQIAARVRAAVAVPGKPLIWPMATLGTLAVALGIVGLAAPKLFATQWLRFTDPFGDHPPYSPIDFRVEPGDTRVIYGNAMDVRATPQGGTVEQVRLVFRSEGQAEESVPMFPEPTGAWRATLSNITAGGKYFVQAPGARSRKFAFDVITVPEFRGVRVRVTPPAYTHLPPYDGPVPDRGIAGLAGTRVEIWAKSNRPLSGGTINFSAAAGAPATQPAGSVQMTPIAPGASEVTGAITIGLPGKLNLTIVDAESQPSREPYSTAITVLKDERPFVRMLEPPLESFATPDAKIDVNLMAEDDYGISSLQLYRGLNDSPAIAAPIPVPLSQPTRWPATVPLNLSQYGLTPGDVIKLYARVEDNDPAGAKGFESPVVSIRIVSNEDFQRMALERDGLETLEAKYAMAARRLEILDDKLAKLQEELSKLPPDSPLAKEKQNQLNKLAREMNESADEVADAAKQDLPFDIDKEFKQHLGEVAKSMSDAAKAAEELSKSGLPSGAVARKLGEVRKKLGAEREQFKKEVTQPLDNLDKIYPLVEDQARYIELWERQQDLATRMKSLVGQAADDPHVKARMRDLEAEQRQLQQDLTDLLNDIRNHAARLPVVTGPMVQAPKGLMPVNLAAVLFGALIADDAPATQPSDLKDTLEKLQQTAFDFFRHVKESGAGDQMGDAAARLGEFDGAKAAASAQQAADTLKKFISECNGMGQQCRGMGVLVFAPKICNSMGNTIDQLLGAEGLNPGGGVGAASGYSQRRSSLRNMGMYGRLPTRTPAGGNRSGRNAAGPGASGNPNGGDASEPGAGPGSEKLQASGESDVAVPPQYKQKVGEYFQRVADELQQ